MKEIIADSDLFSVLMEMVEDGTVEVMMDDEGELYFKKKTQE